MFEVLAVNRTGLPFTGSLGENDQDGFGAQPASHRTVLQVPMQMPNPPQVVASPVYGFVQDSKHDDAVLQRLVQ
jgi:hypothetical protein